MLLFEFLNLDLRNGGRIGQAPADFLLAALRESGYEPPNPATDRDILAQVDRVIETIGERDQVVAERHERALLLGAAVACAAGDPYAAQTFLDGPAGAGIGWDLTKQEIRRRLA